MRLSLDCAAAFNAAPLDPIIERLETMGFREARGIFSWLGADGAFRRRRLSKRENWETTTSGVLQGPVLGPILWLSSRSSAAEWRGSSMAPMLALGMRCAVSPRSWAPPL